jgi:hypothetical protein
VEADRTNSDPFVMSISFNDERLDFNCPGCDAPVKITLGEARRSPTMRCPNGHTIDIDASDLDRKTKEVERAMRDLDRTLKDFGK